MSFPALHRIGTGAAIEHVVATVADEGIRERVAGAIQVRRADEREIFEIGPHAVADGTLNGVEALVQVLGELIAWIVHHIGVITGPADQNVCPRAAVEQVVAAAPIKRVDTRPAEERIVPPIALEQEIRRGVRAGEGIVPVPVPPSRLRCSRPRH